MTTPDLPTDLFARQGLTRHLGAPAACGTGPVRGRTALLGALMPQTVVPLSQTA